MSFISNAELYYHLRDCNTDTIKLGVQSISPGDYRVIQYTKSSKLFSVQLYNTPFAFFSDQFLVSETYFTIDNILRECNKYGHKKDMEAMVDILKIIFAFENGHTFN